MLSACSARRDAGFSSIRVSRPAASISGSARSRKRLVGCGGYVAGSTVLVDLLKCHAPGFVYSVGMPASVAAASAKALAIMNAEPERVAKLQANSQYFLTRAKARGLDTGDAWGYAIIPVIVGETVRTLVLAERLQRRGFNAFPILPPGVPEKSARLRFFHQRLTYRNADRRRGGCHGRDHGGYQGYLGA